MPHLRGITVHVTDSQGTDLEEWGIHVLKKGSLASAYIQSTTNMSFMVSVQPNIPFVNTDALCSDGPKKATNEDKNSHLQLQHASGSSSRQLPSRSEGQIKNQEQQRMSRSSPLSQVPHQKTPPPPEFSLIAFLYLDGRPEPERKVLIFLDPANSDFAKPDGKVMFKHRWVQAKDGTVKEHAWFFKDRPVESVLTKLVIAGAQDQAETQDEREDDMINAMKSAGVKEETDYIREGATKVGQILVQIERVVIGKTRTDKNYRSRHQEGQDNDIDMDGVRPDITHAAGFTPKNTLPSNSITVTHFVPYKAEEGVFAEFKFFYRSQGRYQLATPSQTKKPDHFETAQLEKYNFPGFNRTLKPPASNARMLNSRMANLTPLSISNPAPKQKSKRKIETFEDKITKKLHTPENTEAEYSIEGDYRDANSSNESETDEKRPAAALPVLARTPTLGALKSEAKLPTLELIAESDNLTSAAALPPAAEGNRRFRMPPNTPVRKLDPMSSQTPASLNTEASSRAPLTSLTKEKVPRLKITDKDSHRLPAHYQSDLEADADDEADHGAISESDLEAQNVDPEEHECSLNPAENEEPQRNLRSRLARVDLG